MRGLTDAAEADGRFRDGPADGRRPAGGVEKPGGFFNVYGAPVPGVRVEKLPGFFNKEARSDSAALSRMTHAAISPVGLLRRITYNQSGL